jgi:hypothetical protein
MQGLGGAPLAAGIPIISIGRSAIRDGRLKRLSKHNEKFRRFLFGQASAWSRRTNSRLKKRFLGVNVPHTCNQTLIHEERLDACRTILDECNKSLLIQFGQRVWS